MQHLPKKDLCNFQDSTCCGGVGRAWGQGWMLKEHFAAELMGRSAERQDSFGGYQ